MSIHDAVSKIRSEVAAVNRRLQTAACANVSELNDECFKLLCGKLASIKSIESHLDAIEREYASLEPIEETKECLVSTSQALVSDEVQTGLVQEGTSTGSVNNRKGCETENLADGSKDDADDQASKEAQRRAEFVPSDERLNGLSAKELVRRTFPLAVKEGKFSEEDMKFLQFWNSGTYFQSVPLPVLFPFDCKLSDISQRNIGGFGYFKDISIPWRGKQFRLLATYWGEKALPTIANWLLCRGFSISDVRSAGKAIAFDCADLQDDVDPSVDYFSGIEPEKRRTWAVKDTEVGQPDLFVVDDSAARMAAVKRLADGSIAAREVAGALRKQLKLHYYKPRYLADGIGVDRWIVSGWLNGCQVIHPNEEKAIYEFLKIKNMFDGI